MQSGVPVSGVSTRQRVAAIIALVAAIALVVMLVGTLFRGGLWLLVGLVGLALTAGGGWVAVTERMPRRAVGAVGAGIGVVVILLAVVQVAQNNERPVLRIAVLVLLILIGLAATRVALEPELHEADVIAAGGADRPVHPVLICNPWSGGGKVARFDLVAKAQALGVEVVMLDKGLDLEELARDAIARGADCIGMAGGDGSQALVAAIAIEHGIPFVCISAGTRNHFAQDLGFDKEDPAAGLIAFTEGVPRNIDYATVGDRLFVNNVSLGVYATVVQEDSYRAAKVETAKSLLPDILGSTAEPFDLQFTTPDGKEIDGAFLVMVSNNAYISGLSPDSFQRRAIDSGELGVIAVNSSTGADAAALMARVALGRAGRDPHLHRFTCREFEVGSRSGSAFAGVDGEALDLPTPLVFRSHPAGLRLLVPPANIVASEKRRARGFDLKDLLAVAAGHSPNSRPEGAAARD